MHYLSIPTVPSRIKYKLSTQGGKTYPYAYGKWHGNYSREFLRHVRVSCINNFDRRHAVNENIRGVVPSACAHNEQLYVLCLSKIDSWFFTASWRSRLRKSLPFIVNGLKCASNRKHSIFFIACVLRWLPYLSFFIHSNYLIVRWIEIGGTAWQSSTKRQAMFDQTNYFVSLFDWISFAFRFTRILTCYFSCSTHRRNSTHEIQARTTDIFRNTRHRS